MKNYSSLVLLFFCTFAFSQIQEFKRKSNNPKAKIIKVETSTYAFDDDLNKYVLRTSEEFTYNINGYITRSQENQFGSSPSNNFFTYNYNKDNQMVFFDMVYKNSEPLKTTYKYEKGNIIEIKSDGRYGTTTKIEYDKNGELWKEKTLNSNGELISDSYYQNFKNNENYRKVTNYLLDGEIYLFTNVELQNGKKIIDSKLVFETDKSLTTSNATYKYEKNGNVIEKKISTAESPKIYDYVFDQFGEIIKSHTKEQSINNKTFTHYLYFTKYTYQDGTSTGSANFDSDFAKKYQK